jgi:hypothetical protein
MVDNKLLCLNLILENHLSYLKKVFLSTILICVSSLAFAAKDIHSTKVNYIYQLDSDATVFEFSSSVSHGCGSNLYRVKSPNELEVLCH